MKIGRNDPCPCGSGKKYKHCCLSRGAALAVESPALSAQRKAHEYLKERFRTQLGAVVAETFFGRFDNPDELNAALGDLDDGLQQMLAITVDDWLLCEAEYERRGVSKRGVEWALADAQLRLSAAERACLQAMALAPLRLHEVTGVEHGRGFFLRDLHETGAPARFVHEVSGTRNAMEGNVVGVRVIEDPDLALRISGVVYTFSRSETLDILEEIQLIDAPVDDTLPPDVPMPIDDGLVSEIILEHWLDRLLGPKLPLDFLTGDGEKMLMIEDDYDVLDADALQEALAAETDVDRNDEQSWVRVLRTIDEADGADADSDDDDDDGFLASILCSIYPGEVPGTIVLFHRSAAEAERGREWFDRVAGGATRHRERREIDPTEVLAKGGAGVPPPASKRPEGMTPEEHSAFLAQGIRSLYKDWCDLPLPILSGATPREMLETREDREHLRFLLRTYELQERKMASEQDRPPVSYDFLWEKLGLQREEPML